MTHNKRNLIVVVVVEMFEEKKIKQQKLIKNIEKEKNVLLYDRSNLRLYISEREALYR